VAVLAVLLVGTAGVAMAAPGNAPVDTPADDKADDKANEEEKENGDQSNNESAQVEENQGPPEDLPVDENANVPDHVSEIHSLINQFIDDELDNLGQAISDLMSGSDGESSNNAQ
ncbi:MAG: hypothetical protein SV377_03520, partial [Halobacteria archaeon]|nr:hypothetical protein [Halobacteria archaeon]